MEKEFELREKRLEEERKKRLAAIEAREKRNAAAASRANDAPSAPSASRVGATPLSFARSTSQNSSRDFGRGGDSIWEENAMNSGVGSISIGSFANASGPGGIAIGFGARSVGNGIAIGTRSFAGPGDVSIGSGSGARFPGHGQRLDSSGWGGIAIGNNVRVEGNGIAIGNNLHARPGEVKIGQTATTQPTSPASSNTSATRPTDAIGYYPGIGLQGNLIGKKVIIRCGFNETVLSINNSTNEIELISKEAELAFGNLFLTASECIFTVMDGGNMQIAFCHDKTGKYLQMNLQGTVNGHPSLTDLSKFYVVHCEEGRFAFYNKLFQRYLCLSEDEESIIASPMKHNIDEFPSTEFRWREQFTLIWALEESPSFLISSTFMDPSGASGYGEKLKLSTLRKLVSTIPNRQTKHEFVCILFDLMLNYSFNHLASLQLQVFPHLSRYTKRRISAYFQLVMIDFMLFTQKQRFSLDDIVTALLLKDADTSPMANPKLPFISLDDCKAMIWSPLFPLPKQYKPSLQVAFLFRDYQHALMNFIPLIIQRVNEAVWREAVNELLRVSDNKLQSITEALELMHAQVRDLSLLVEDATVDNSAIIESLLLKVVEQEIKTECSVVAEELDLQEQSKSHEVIISTKGHECTGVNEEDATISVHVEREPEEASVPISAMRDVVINNEENDDCPNNATQILDLGLNGNL